MKITKRFFWPDSHFGDQDPKAIAITLSVLKDFRPDELIILGDFWDMYCVSRFDKNPNKMVRLIEEEVESGIEFFQKLYKLAPKIIFLAGNHEARLTKYLNVYAPVLSSQITLRSLLKIPQDVRIIPYGQGNYYKFDNFIATHGDVTGEHATAKMVKKYMANVIHGHTHALQVHNIRDIHGNDFLGYSCGHLSRMKEAEYVTSTANWCHGFGLSYSRGGRAHVQLVPIIDYQLCWNGRICDGKK